MSISFFQILTAFIAVSGCLIDCHAHSGFRYVSEEEKTVSGLDHICEYDESSPSTSLQCITEQGSFITHADRQLFTADAAQPSSLILVEYNIDRNGYGNDGPNENGLEGIISAIRSLGKVDVILLSEVSRDCPSYGFQNGAEEIARTLGMAWAYSVEFLLITDQQTLNAGYQCTIGNAILSSMPMESVKHLRFASQCCRFPHRIGGRSVIKATIPAFNMTVASSHLESGTGFSDILESALVRVLQSIEMADLVEPDLSHHIVAIGGDFNAPLRQFMKGKAYKCYLDPLEKAYGWPRRNTSTGVALAYFGLAAFDYVYFKNYEAYYIESEICKTNACYGFSDHYPLKFSLKIKKDKQKK